MKRKKNLVKEVLMVYLPQKPANNAACSGSFVPMLTLGIPGSGTTAVMLGALLGFGVQPGPRLYMTNPEIFLVNNYVLCTLEW
jgi:putative tricarboxylic transport membrane protein